MRKRQGDAVTASLSDSVSRLQFHGEMLHGGVCALDARHRRIDDARW